MLPLRIEPNPIRAERKGAATFKQGALKPNLRRAASRAEGGWPGHEDTIAVYQDAFGKARGCRYAGQQRDLADKWMIRQHDSHATCNGK